MRGIINFVQGSILMLSLLVIIAIPLVVFWYVGKCRMFKKAKEKEWQAIIPIYDYYVLTQITETNWWWFLIASLPIIYFLIGFRMFLLHFYLVSLIGKFVINYNLVKKFRKNDIFALAMTILPLPFYCYLGLSHDKINNRVKITPNGPFDDYAEEIIEEEKEVKVVKPKKVVPVVSEVIVDTVETKLEEIKEEKVPVKEHVKKKATATKKEAIKKKKEMAKIKKETVKPVKKSDPTLKKKYARKLEQARLEKEELKKANIKKNTKKKVKKAKKNK